MDIEQEIKLTVNEHFMDYVTNWDHQEYLLVGSYGSSKSYETATKLILKLLSEKLTRKIDGVGQKRNVTVKN